LNKGTKRYNWIHCRKWIVTWTILILILSLISLSAGSGNDTESHENAGTDPDSKIVTDKDVQSGKDTEEDTVEELAVEDLEAKGETETGTDGQKTDSESHEKNSKVSINTDDQESTGETQKTASDSEESTDNQEGAEENLESKEKIEDTGETATEKNTGIQESLEEITEIETETGQDTGNQENPEENSEGEEVEGYSTDTQKSSRNNLATTTEKEQDTDDQGNSEGYPEVQTEVKDHISSSGSNEDNSEAEIKIDKVIDDKKNSKKSQVAGEAECCITDDQKSSCKSTSQEEETEESSGSTEKLEVNLKAKTCEDNKKDSSEYSGTEIEKNTESYDGSKNPGPVEVETEGAANSGETDQRNDDLETRINIEESSGSYIAEINESKPDESGESSWYNFQYILSHADTLHSFYTAHESVKISYKGPEDLKKQKVYIYLVKTRIPSFSDDAVKNITAGTVSFEDIFSKNLESYIQIPETLNENGDLSSLTLGPLPEGSYWVVITPAENETKSSEQEKTILLAHYFKVLEYEMRARAPNTLEEGENFEVRLNMKNAPAQKNYTCCAVLIRENASRTNTNISSDASGTESMSGTFAEGLRIMEYIGLKETNLESETGNDKLEKEILDLAGKGSGIISIGEENQKTLSLTTSDLPPGNYLLLAGAYEKGKGLEGIAQAELSILEEEKSTGSDTEHKSNTDLSIESQRSSTLESVKSVLDTSSSSGLEGLEPQIRGETPQAGGIVNSPSKLMSFLIGFVGTILIGIALLSRRR